MTDRRIKRLTAEAEAAEPKVMFRSTTELADGGKRHSQIIADPIGYTDNWQTMGTVTFGPAAVYEFVKATWTEGPDGQDTPAS
jgi:hypothetical protein